MDNTSIDNLQSKKKHFESLMKLTRSLSTQNLIHEIILDIEDKIEAEIVSQIELYNKLSRSK